MPFQYLAPDSLDEAITLLVEHGEDAKLLAGGQSLVPLMAFRMVRPSVLVDLRKIEALHNYRLDGDLLTIGSMVTHRRVELDRAATARCAMLAEAIEQVGHVAIRNFGTVGGSLAHADPAAEWPAVALALDGHLTIAGPAGSRVARAADFFIDWMTTSLAPDEVLTQVRIALPSPGTGSAFEEVSRRHGDFAIVAAAAVITVAGPVITRARIALAGAALTPIRARSAEAVLVGSSLTAEDLQAAGEAASTDIDPVADLHGSETYRRRLAAALTRRSVAHAYRRAGNRG